MDESVQKHLTPAIDEASKLLLKAADYIEANGLCQGSAADGNRLCTIRAIHAMNGGKSFWGTTAEKAYHRLRDRVGLVSHWSDSTPQSEVVAKLRAVALSGR